MGCLFALFAGVFPRLAVAAILDLGHWGASATRRDQIPGRRASEA